MCIRDRSSTGPAWTVTDAEPDDAAVREPGAWLVDPDGAVVGAGLVRHYAARHDAVSSRSWCGGWTSTRMRCADGCAFGEAPRSPSC